MNYFFNEAEKLKVIPVVVFNNIEEIEPIMDALKEGGLKIAEITFRTDCALDALSLAARKYPDFLIGAGTVLNRTQAENAIQRGARFIVGPGFSQSVCKVCQENDVPYLPGCATPTEIMQALENNISVVKFFPANIYGGMKAIKAFSAAFPQVRFIPTGGVDIENIQDYLDFDKVLAVGGSWMVKGDAKAIIEKTRTCMERIKK